MILLSYMDAGLLAYVPFALLLLSIFSFYKAYRASRSGSTIQVGTGTDDAHVEDSNQNVPIYKTGGPFIFGVILLVAAIASYLLIAADYA